MAFTAPPLISNKRGRDSGNNQANTSEESDKRLKPGTSEEPDTSKEPDKRLSRRVDGCVKTMEGSLKEIGDFTRDRTSNQIVAVAYRELLLTLQAYQGQSCRTPRVGANLHHAACIATCAA